jgi:tRNA (guanine-N7-)-methyltransferase
MDDDAVQIIKNRIPDGSLDRLQLFFPDPWHKTKHNKRRLVNDDNLKLFAAKLQKIVR